MIEDKEPVAPEVDYVKLTPEQTEELAVRPPSPVEDISLNRSENTKLQLKLTFIGGLAFLLAGIMVWKKDWFIQQPQLRAILPEAMLASPMPSSPLPQISPEPTAFFSPGPYLNPTASINNAYVLQHKDASGEFKTVASVDPSKVVRWRDTIIFQNLAAKENLEIVGLDLQTNTVKQITFMSNEEYKSEENLTDALSDLKVIGDDLYISLGGFLTEGATYWLSMTSATKPTKVATTHNARVTNVDSRYFIQGGDGDGCGGVGEYYLLNPDTHTAKLIENTKEGCVEGLGFVGKDATNFYFSDHTTNESDGYSEIYHNLIQLNIDSGEKTTLIDKEKMPEHVGTLTYFPEKNKLLLLAESPYLYDLQTKSLNKVQDWDAQKDTLSWSKGINDAVCISRYPRGGGADGTTHFELNLESNTISSTANCPAPEPKSGSYQQEQFDKNASALNLPTDYRVFNLAPREENSN